MSDGKSLEILKIPKPARTPCPACPRPSFVWQCIKFCNKLFVAGGLVYYTHHNGVWGSPEESRDFVKNLSNHIRIMSPYYIEAFIWREK